MEQRAIRVGGPGEVLPAYLRSAVDFILTNLAETFLLDDIAAAAGVSKRTLHLGFQVNFGLAVMAFVRQHRLELANRQLLAGDVESTTVTSVAMNCGFQHLSRFSGIYRQCFGEYPSETLRRRSRGAPSFGGHQTIVDADRKRASRSVSSRALPDGSYQPGCSTKDGHWRAIGGSQ